jgi:heterodisulfide reductase subunit C
MEGITIHQLKPSEKRFLEGLERLSGQNIFKCLQCGTCSAICPALSTSDLTPNQLLHRLMLGRMEGVVDSLIAWRCMSCRLCQERCPRGLDLAKFLAAFRQQLLAANRDRSLRPESFPAQERLEAPQILLVGCLRDHSF